jgi:hypothetical protein
MPLFDHRAISNFLPLEASMASAPISQDRKSARIDLVERHVPLENEHNLEGA